MIIMNKTNIAAFIDESPLRGFTESLWDGRYYCRNANPEDKSYNIFDNAHALIFNVYSQKLAIAKADNPKAAIHALWLAEQVNDLGCVTAPEGYTAHPAINCTVADALATAAWYAADIGLDDEARKDVVAAVMRIKNNNHRLRYPEGAMGKTQQLRFELRLYYWAWLLSGGDEEKKQFFELFDRGVHSYTNRVAMDGFLTEPSLYPDWTWNYAIVGSSKREYATNVHTPAYYCTEPNGFMFVYLHGIKNGFIKRNDVYDDFCRNYIKGLYRNLSRNGHLASDLDGYGIHRAWFAPVLIEGVPLDAAAMSAQLEMTRHQKWLRWYVERYLEFVKSSSEFEKTGLCQTFPFGHKIGIEGQFSVFSEIRFYASLSRYLAEYGVDGALTPKEPEAFGSYAWHSDWLRISTPVYETSFVGATSLRNIPVVKNFGDPHLGTLIGGAPLSTIFAGNELMYSAAFPLEGLWNIRVVDHNGRIVDSAATSYDDNYQLTVRHSGGRLVDAQSFNDYDPAELIFIEQDEYIESSWNRYDSNPELTYSVKNLYNVDEIEIRWAVRARAGHYLDKISFCLPVVAEGAEYCCGGKWQSITSASADEIPQALRWSVGKKRITISTSFDKDPANLRCRFYPLAEEDGMPGGINSYCPYPLIQVAFEITPDINENRWQMKNTVTFDSQ